MYRIKHEGEKENPENFTVKHYDIHRSERKITLNRKTNSIRLIKTNSYKGKQSLHLFLIE